MGSLVSSVQIFAADSTERAQHKSKVRAARAALKEAKMNAYKAGVSITPNNSLEDSGTAAQGMQAFTTDWNRFETPEPHRKISQEKRRESGAAAKKIPKKIRTSSSKKEKKD